jgi:hypothetical protein
VLVTGPLLILVKFWAEQFAMLRLTKTSNNEGLHKVIMGLFFSECLKWIEGIFIFKIQTACCGKSLLSVRDKCITMLQQL